jgi:UDP-glucose:(heptosyl)LPS alpha-1,3-glucosyltransferase
VTSAVQLNGHRTLRWREMRIGIAHIEHSRRKGIERCAVELAERIAAEGHEVHFHCSQWKSAEDSRVILHHVPTWNVLNSARIATYAISGQRSLREGKYDVTHSHGGLVGCDIVTAHSCHRAGMEIRRKLKEKAPRTRKNWGVADRIRLMIEQKNYAEHRYKKVVAVSGGVKRELVEYYDLPDGDIVVIPNGVDLNEFSPANRLTFRDRIREQLQISPDAPVLIFVGNEFDRKGLSFIIGALPLVKIPELKLLVLGGDNRFPYLGLARKLGVDGQILFIGSVQEISQYYAASDLFVFPTFYEAFSLAVLEAAASGLPLLVTKVNGTEEFVVDGANGYFITRDPEDIAEKIQLLISDSEQLRTLGLNARRTAENYSWDIIAENTLRVYEEVIRIRQ